MDIKAAEKEIGLTESQIFRQCHYGYLDVLNGFGTKKYNVL